MKTRTHARAHTHTRRLATRVQQRFRGWRTRRSIFGVLTPHDSASWDGWALRSALQRRRAGLVLLRTLRRLHAKLQWQRIGPMLKQLFLFARLEREFAANIDAIVTHALAPLQQALTVPMAPALVNPKSPSVAALLAPTPDSRAKAGRQLDMCSARSLPRSCCVVCTRRCVGEFRACCRWAYGRR